jgi:hypothetical protein
VLIALASGCQPQKPANPRANSDTLSDISSGDGGMTSPDQLLSTDPCASRLQDIGGTLLLYYSVNRHMPAKLEEIKPLADFDQDLQFTCPLSGKPYGYTPTGLAAVGKEKRIVVYDSEPSHNGKRWCVFMPPPRPGKAMSVEVLEVPEGLFDTYTLMP